MRGVILLETLCATVLGALVVGTVLSALLTTFRIQRELAALKEVENFECPELNAGDHGICFYGAFQAGAYIPQ